MSLLEALQTGQWTQDPEQNKLINQGLLQFGLSMMSGKGKLGEVIGNSGLSTMQGLNQYKQQQFQEMLQKEQLRQMANRKKLEELAPQYVRPSAVGVDATGGMETDTSNPSNVSAPKYDLHGLAQAMLGTPGGMEQGINLMQGLRKSEAPTVVNAGATAISPTGTVIYHNSKDQNPTNLSKLWGEMKALPPGHPMTGYYQQAIDKEARDVSNDKLQWDKYTWENTSPLERAKLALERSRAVNDSSRTNFETGQGAGVPSGVLPPNAQPPQANQPPALTTQPTQRPVSTITPIQAPKIDPRTLRPVSPVQTAPTQTPIDIPIIDRPDISPKEKQALRVQQPKEESAAQAIMQTFDRAIDTSKELRTHKGMPSIVGPIDQWKALDVFPETRGARGLQETLISQVGIQALNDMRAMSKTGGAVGQVTEKEWPILQQSVAALDKAQGPGEYKVALQNLENQLKSSRDRVRQAYESTYGKIKYTPTEHVTQGRNTGGATGEWSIRLAQ